MARIGQSAIGRNTIAGDALQTRSPRPTGEEGRIEVRVTSATMIVTVKG